VREGEFLEMDDEAGFVQDADDDVLDETAEILATQEWNRVKLATR